LDQDYGEDELEDAGGLVNVISVGGRRYRKRTVAYSRSSALTWDMPAAAANTDDEPTCVQSQEEMTATFACPAEYRKFFIGRQGATKSRLEAETGCTLHIPEGDSGSVTIAGPSDAAVESMIGRLEILATNAKQALPPTHFLSLPLARRGEGGNDKGMDCRDALEALRTKALVHGQRCAGFAPGMVTRTDRFHLTLAVLKLYTPAEVRKAAAVLSQLGTSFSRALASCSGDSSIVLEGLEIMNDDPSMVDVLYVKVGEGPGTEALRKISIAALNAMLTAGLLSSEEAEAQWLMDSEGLLLPPKLHATLVNTKRRAAGTNRETFDASPLLQALGTEHIARCPLEGSEVHLSEMAGGADDGYYKSAARVGLNATA
jgi:activating signal cointegrator complex subunit 1